MIIVTIDELAEKFHVTPQTIRNWAREYGLPQLPLPGAARYDLEAVEEWARSEEKLNSLKERRETK